MITSFDPLVTSQYPLWLSAVHWFAHLFVAACLLAATTALWVLLGAKMPWPLVAAVCVLPFLLAPFSLAVDILEGRERAANTATIGYGRLHQMELVALAPPSLGLSALVAVFAYRAAGIAHRYRQILLSRHLPEPTLRSALPSAPLSLGDDIIRVEAQDHYVMVTTTEGAVTLKLAFSDCVAALADFRGMQSHRSHWVRFKHVKKVRRSGSAYLCKLSDGTDIPVSRRRYTDLKKKL